MPSRASQSITPNPPTVLFDCCGLMDVQSITIRTVPLSTAKEPYWHCHHSSIGILLLFSSERRTQHLSDWLKPNFFIFLFLFIYVKFRSSSHFGFGDVETNVSIGRNCQIGLPHPRDADAHRRVVQGQYLLCTTFHFGVFFFGVSRRHASPLLLHNGNKQKAYPLFGFSRTCLFDPEDEVVCRLSLSFSLSLSRQAKWSSLT